MIITFKSLRGDIKFWCSSGATEDIDVHAKPQGN